MFRNELTVKSINSKSIVCNRYLNSNFWHAYGFKHFQRDIFGHGTYVSVMDTYSRYINTAHGRRYQTMSIVFEKRNGEPFHIDGFNIATYNERWQTLVSYNSYKPEVKKWTC